MTKLKNSLQNICLWVSQLTQRFVSAYDDNTQGDKSHLCYKLQAVKNAIYIIYLYMNSCRFLEPWISFSMRRYKIGGWTSLSCHYPVHDFRSFQNVKIFFSSLARKVITVWSLIFSMSPVFIPIGNSHLIKKFQQDLVFILISPIKRFN